MSSNTYPLNATTIVPASLSSISSPLTNVVVDADAGNSSLLITNDTNNSLYIDKYSNVAINHASPAAQLDINSANGACMLLRYNGTSNLSTMYMSSAGKLSINASGGEVNTTSNMVITSSTGSTSTSTGALVISGGVGIGEKLYVNSGIYGTLQTAAQPNITSVGDLTGLTLNGVLDSTSGWIDTSSSFRCTGGSTPTYGNGIGLRYNGYQSTGFLSSHNHQLGTHNNIDIQDSIIYIKSDGKLGFTTNTPYAFMDINQASSTSNRLRLSYTINSVYTELYCDASGILQLGGITSTGVLTLSNTTDSSSTTTGSVIISGGVGIAKKIYIGDNLNVASGHTITIGSTSMSETDMGKIVGITNGTVAANKAVVVDASRNIATVGNITSDGVLTLSNATDASSTTTGSVIISGGVGIAKKLYVGSDLNLSANINVGGTQIVDSSRNATFTTVITTTEAFANSTTKAATTAYVQNEFMTRSAATLTPSGFENTTDSVITYNQTTRILTVSPASTSFSVWVNGVRYTYSTPQTTTVHGTTAASTYFYYFNASGVLTFEANTIPSLFNIAPAAFVYYYDATHTMCADERHGTVMDPSTHTELHRNIGTYYVSGLAINNYTLSPSSPVDSDNTFSITSGIIADEDLHLVISALAIGGPYTLLQLVSAGNWTWTTGNTVPFYYSVGSYINYNQFTGTVWQLTNVGSTNRWLNYYVCFAPSIVADTQVLILPGQVVHTSLDDARAENFYDLSISTMPFPEFLPLYQITFRTASSYSSAGKCRIEAITRIVGTKVSIVANTQVNHEALSGLQLATTGITYGHITDQAQSIAGAKTFIDTTDASSTTTGAVIVSGGVGIAKKLYVGDNLNVATTKTITIGSTSMNETDMAKIVGITNGTVAASKALVVDASRNIATIGNITSDGVLTLTNTTDASSTSTGSIITSGGVGIAKNLYVGTGIYGTLQTAAQTNITSVGTLTGLTVSGVLTLTNTTDASSTSTGAVIISGGVGIAKKLYVGTGITTSAGSTITSGGAANYTTAGTENVYKITASTLTNASTATSGTDANFRSMFVLNAPTLAATNTGVITTSAATLYISGAPINGTNNTITNSYGIYSGGNIGTSGVINTSNTTDASSISTGSIITAGGMGIAKKLYIGDNLNVASTKTITIGGTTMSETDMGKIVGITNGTAAASKALVLDSSSNIAGINSVGAATADITSYIQVGTSTDTSRMISVGVSGMADASRTFILTGGKLNSTSNQFELAYYHVADGNTSNRLEIGRHGATGIITMQFDSKVGINKATPAYTLDVAGDISLSGSLRNGSTVFMNSSGLLSVAGQTNITSVGTLTSLSVSSASPNSISIQNTLSTSHANILFKASGATDTELGIRGSGDTQPTSGFYIYQGAFRFCISSTGNVGIPSNNPQYQLDVGGDISLSGSLRNGATVFMNSSGVLSVAGQTNITSVGTLTGLTVSGVLTESNTTDSSSTSTGAVIISGGVGIAKKLYVGDTTVIGSGKTLTVGTNTADTGIQVSCLDSTITNASRKLVYSGGKASTANNRFELAYYHVSDGSTSNRFEIGASGTTNIVAVQFDGKVGMGTATPICRLHLGATTTNQVLCAYGTGTTASDVFYGWGTNDSFLKHQADVGHSMYVASKGNGVGTEVVRITSAGMYIGSGTTASYPLHVGLTTGTSAANYAFYAFTPSPISTNTGTYNGGSTSSISIYATGRMFATEYDAYSDRRIKTDLQLLTDEYCDRLLNVAPYMYKKIPTDTIELGFMAQDVLRERISEIVGVDDSQTNSEYLTGDVDEYGVISHEGVMYTLNYNGFIPMLLNLVKRNRTKIETLTAENEELKTKVANLETALDQIMYRLYNAGI